MIPSHLLKEMEFKKRLKNFQLYYLIWVLTAFVKLFLQTVFKRLENTDEQCIIAFLIPVGKRFTAFLFSKVMHRMVGTKNEKANVALTISMHFTYGLILAIAFVDARSSTMICMVKVEFLIQSKMIMKCSAIKS